MTDLNEPIIRAQLARIGLTWVNCISWNAEAYSLYAAALERGEAKAAKGGALVVSTGAHTGRSPKDKYIVRDGTTENAVWWDNAGAMSPAQFAVLKADFLAHARLKTLFVQDLIGGADPLHELPTRVVTEKAWHALFMRHLLIEPLDTEDFVPELTIINLPSFKADPRKHGTRSQTVIAMDLTQGLVLIGGTEYAGEMKKSVFTVLNYELPQVSVLPMHCAANSGKGGDVAVFFGLSGTGKTTLSADPDRMLIGDDEHGWSSTGVFNFEGGCYAKVINLTPSAEPAIYAAATAPGTVLENVVLEQSGEIDFSDCSLTENTRAAYPLAAIANAVKSGRGGIPTSIIMLTADAFGVLPPIAKLNPDEAMFHFMSGYTAKLAGTENGITEPQATFSACFGAPFLPRHPSVYGALLRDLMAEHNVKCYLVNTGWSGGGYGTGSRMPLEVTRRLVTAALDGEVDKAPMRLDENFGFAVPTAIAGVAPAVLNPRETWPDRQAYDRAARKLAQLFDANFQKFEARQILQAAE
jgi:phosphoenolpyruvate carboxykinase (ATP)